MIAPMVPASDPMTGDRCPADDEPQRDDDRPPDRPAPKQEEQDERQHQGAHQQFARQTGEKDWQDAEDEQDKCCNRPPVLAAGVEPKQQLLPAVGDDGETGGRRIGADRRIPDRPTFGQRIGDPDRIGVPRIDMADDKPDEPDRHERQGGVQHA
jgi:hypothetical protein